MKTLHLPSAYLPWATGGTEIYCHRLCQNLQSLGVETLVSYHQRLFLEETSESYTYERVPVHVLPPLLDPTARVALYARTTQNAFGFEQLLADYQPDIVHFHNFSVSQGLTHLHLAKQAGCKLILTYHSPTVSCSQHGLLYRSQIPCDGRISLQRCSECRLVGAGLSRHVAKLAAQWSLPWVNPSNPNSIARLVTTRAMTTVFRDSWQEMLELIDGLHVLANWAKDVVELNGAPSHKVHLIRTGGPEPVVSVAMRSQSGIPLRIAFIGRSTLIKGMHILVEAVKQLPRDLPVQVTFFRNGRDWEEKAYGQELQQQMESDNRIEIKYNLPNDELLQVLSGFDLCVVPSLWLETGPLVVLEAFAAGVPVLGSRLGGIAELVQDGVDGLLFEPGNSAELAALIEGLIRSPDRLEQLRKHVKPPRTMTNVAKDILALYQQL